MIYIYISLASTVSKMSVEIIVKCKKELLLKMGTPPSLRVTHLSQLQHGRKRYTVEVLEAVFSDKDSDNDIILLWI